MEYGGLPLSISLNAFALHSQCGNHFAAKLNSPQFRLPQSFLRRDTNLFILLGVRIAGTGQILVAKRSLQFLLGCRKGWRVHLYNPTSARELSVFNQARVEDEATSYTHTINFISHDSFLAIISFRSSRCVSYSPSAAP